MEEEVVIIVTPKLVEGEKPDESKGIRRVFKGPDRFKKARRFLQVLSESEEG